MKSKYEVESVRASVKAQKLVSGTRDLELLKNPAKAAAALSKKNEVDANVLDARSVKLAAGGSPLVELVFTMMDALYGTKRVVRNHASDIFNQEFKKTIKNKG